ncbi:MAG TPA: DUF2381 family protein [Archangium sp.]|nr:DUF2381 family protein [Archangium sp.]
MLPSPPSALLALVLLQGNEAPLSGACEDIQRIELYLSSAVAQEVCVSPGLVTSFTFDVPPVVELQDDVRFAEVMRGRSGLSIVPPPDMAPGERIRLTARWGEGHSQQSVTFVLVMAHPGRATRQVEVSRDKRPREALLQENAQERAVSQRLREQVQRLQAQLVQSGGLLGLLRAGSLGNGGILARQLKQGPGELPLGDALSFSQGTTYRSKNSVAAEVWLENSGSEPWIVEGASLVSPTGEKLEGVRVGQEEIIAPQQTRRVFIEADAASGIPLGELTLRVWGADGRAISIPNVTFP